MLSPVLQRDFGPAPEKIVNLITGLKREYTEFLDENNDVEDLPMAYIAEKVVGQTSLVDCLYIAPATINQVDLLVSWSR